MTNTGTCIDLFDGCDGPDDFLFTSHADALAASTALLDQVFIDGVAGAFDSQPQLTSGCDDLFDCIVTTPHSVGPGEFVAGVVAINNVIEAADQTAPSGGLRELDFGPLIDETYAKWTTSPVAVPLPGGLVLFLSACAAMVLGHQRKHKRQPTTS